MFTQTKVQPNPDALPSPLRLLHLEDDPGDADLVRAQLEREALNAQITHVRGRDDFSEALKQKPFDLILADCSLRDYDGFEALQLARQETPGIPFIFVSGSINEEMAVRSLQQGATDFLVKSNLVRLGSAVRRALREVREHHDRDQAVSQLRRSQQELADFFDNAPVGLHWAGPDGRILKVNHAELEMLGYTSAEYLGHHVSEFHVDPAFKQDVLARLARGETVGEYEAHVRCKDGAIKIVLIETNALWEKGRLVHTRSFTRDITKRHHAEEALRASEHHYRLLFENNPTPVSVIDSKSLAFLAVNEAAVRHYGYSREEFLQNDPSRTLPLPEELRAFLDKLSHPGGEAVRAGIWRHRKQDGKLSEMEITSHPVAFAGKQAWLCLAIDVSERLNLEAQFRQSQKMESVGQLAGGIAHDFNNLLTVINGHAGLLLATEELTPRITDRVKEICEAAKRAADLTRQLLTFSRKQVLQPQVVDLNEVVGNVTKMLRRILGEDISLDVDFSPSLPCVKADLGMLEQVLLNLAVNSRDAMPRGGKLRISTSTVIVDDAGVKKNPEAATGRFVCLTFVDNGCGISPENLPRIFEPFFTTKELDRGTGLGLATVYGIIKQHQGWIEVASQPAQGTTFTIFLPASTEQRGSVTMPAGDARVIGGTETILVVEDEAPLLKLIHHILESHGYKVLECGSGRAALELWEEHRKKIDLLFTDMILPDGMGGRNWREILQASKPALKVIYTSGYDAGKLSHVSALREGLNFIQKPFHARKLAETVHDCLHAR